MERERVFVKGGKYLYRVDHRIMEGDCQYDHGPKIVTVEDFYIDKYPVTIKDYLDFLKESSYSPEDKSNFLKDVNEERFNHPVIWVSHKDALAYCEFYNLRLPTDIEWQYAAGHNLKYPWGNIFNKDFCNGNGNSTTPVNKYEKNISPFGCADMCGNVYEWVNDIIDDGMHLFTFVRGGSYYKAPHFWHAEGGAQPNNFHLKFQLLSEALNRTATIGFRCVKEVNS